jgi:hypothetical protein
MQYLAVLRTLALVLILSGCVALPKPPDTPLCSFDNTSKDDRSDKSPNFKCLSSRNMRFKIQWNSESADKMMCTPYADYIKMNAYYKKIFDIIEKEFLNKARK